MENILSAIHERYDWVGHFREGRVAVELDWKWGYNDLDGHEVVSLKYSDVCDYHEGRASVELNGKWGVIDLYGNVVVPFKYDSGGNYCDGRIVVELDGKCGVLDLNGNEVLPCWYMGITKISTGFMTTHRISHNVFESLYFDLDGNILQNESL
jgi:hypothetical protein